MNPTNPSQPFAEHDFSEQARHLRDARLAALQHVALGLTSTLKLSDVLQRVARMAQSLTDSAHAHIYLYDSQADELHLSASHWANEQTPILLKPRRTGITYTVVQCGTPMFIEDSRNHPAYEDVPLDQRPGALACLPLVKGEHILGSLNIGYWQTHPFDSDTRRFLDLMARYAAIAIENAQLYESATRAATELRRLYDTSLDIASQLDTPKLLDLILHRAAELLHGTSGNFYIYNAQTNALVPCAPFGQPEVEPVQGLKPGEGATGRVFQSGEPLVIQDYDSWEGRVAHIPLGRYGRVLHVPVKQGEHIIGVMSVNRPKTAPAFTDAETRLLLLFANQAAVALENARLYQVAVEKARMEQELAVAHRVQVSLMPHDIPQVAGWEFQARWYPAREVSGDFFDFVNLRLPEPAGASPFQRFLIADVSDKGVPAALFMALTRSTLRASITDDRSPAECLTHANRLVSVDTANGMFVTLCYAQLNPVTGELVYVNAGHNLPLWYHCQEDRLIEFVRTGPALGVFDERIFAQESVWLDPGDFVLFYTDGVTDALNPAEEDFGETRLHQVLVEQRYGSAGEIVAALEQSLWAFVGDTPPEDDITFVLVKRLGANVRGAH
ncbi:MAG: SpoIIE family protein phosphatase [Chloroflexi bacterium]|nr:SpoIIE family protein phosphatase [Chloroflexota bacterium]